MPGGDHHRGRLGDPPADTGQLATRRLRHPLIDQSHSEAVGGLVERHQRLQHPPPGRARAAPPAAAPLRLPGVGRLRFGRDGGGAQAGQVSGPHRHREPHLLGGPVDP